MIILDTNVLSELLRPRPEPKVIAWLEQQSPRTLHVTGLSCAEMLLGAALMPAGKRRSEVESLLSTMFTARFDGRVLAFGPEAASNYARIAAERQRAGNRIGPMDGLIAAIALTHGAAVATRDGDFTGCGIAVIDPWEAT